MATQYDFTVNLHDLDFIWQQIKIAEASTTTDGAVDGDKLRDLVSSALLPYGLRTVDGSWNNLLPGQELYGAADQSMPRLTQVNLAHAEYLTQVNPSGFVNDSAPRTISNLICDQTTTNPAAENAFINAQSLPGGGMIDENAGREHTLVSF
ncbi:MAG: hypothetical protein ACRCYV_00305 [Aeromonas sp.]